MEKSLWSPVEMISAAQALTKVLNDLGPDVSFKLRSISGKTYNCGPFVAKGPPDLLTENGIMHHAISNVGLDPNELKAETGVEKHGDVLTAQAIFGTLELGRKFAIGLRKDDPKIILPLSNFESPTYVPAEAEGASEVPFCMVSMKANACSG